MAVADLITPARAPRRPTAPRVRVPRVGVLLAVGWLALLGAGALAAVLGLTADPLSNDYTVISQAPSLAHPFGTDNLGRDV
ncbi:MAG: ABC transporter permease, partial [Herbiconiux sp.]|nr:ABC transporter permease [Herbiconiux sp.]